MNNVYSLLAAQMNTRLVRFDRDFNSMVQLTAARYGVERDHPQVCSIIRLMDNLIKSRLKMHDDLNCFILSIHRPMRKNELIEVRKKLVIGPRRVLTSFHNKITKSNVDLENPRTLAAFKAAMEILDYFLQLEHDYLKVYLEATETHLRLQRARLRQQTLQPLESKQESPQRAEGTR
jgi:hypothetical protein